VIRSFKHKGLRALYEKGTQAGVDAQHAERLRRILARLSVAKEPKDVNLPGFGLHPLQGDRAGQWAVTVRANWRVTFQFEGLDVVDVNYEDYH
jgi:proteic killer suppression protein